MIKLPDDVTELIKLIPKKHSSLKELILKNYKRLNFNKLRVVDLTEDTHFKDFFAGVIKEILFPNQEALTLLKFLLVINTEVETNIDRESLETSYNLPNVSKSFNVLLNKGFIKEKDGNDEKYEFVFSEIHYVLEILPDEQYHENALQYYVKKKNKFRINIADEIEILYHKANLNPTEELVNHFLTMVSQIDQFEHVHTRLIDVAEILMTLEDKYKAPILTALGSIFSVIGRIEDAEKIYLKALEVYKSLANKYFRVYLPYITATQKNLGTLYIDLKRFEEAEKIYSKTLSSYKKIKKKYSRYSLEPDLTDYDEQNETYVNDLKSYNEAIKQYYDVYLPEKSMITNDFDNTCVDLDLLEDIEDESIDSLDYKKLAKMCYDMNLVDIAKTQSNLGIINSELRKFEKAESLHLAALKIKKKIGEKYPDQVLPELVLTLLDLGDLYASLNKFDQAEPMFNEALTITKQLAKKNPEIFLHNLALIQNSLGNVYIKLKKYQQAEQMYLESLKIFKILAESSKTYFYNIADIQNNLGNLFMLLNDLEKSEYYLNKAYKIDPTNRVIIYSMASLESIRNNQIKAIELLKKLIELDKEYIKRVTLDKNFENIRELKEFKELTGN